MLVHVIQYDLKMQAWTDVYVDFLAGGRLVSLYVLSSCLYLLGSVAGE